MVDQSESTPHKTAYKPTSYKPSEPVLHPDRDQSTLRRQMVSVGKQPKATIQRKKKDMVEELYDSLTDYFDPTQGRRTRRRAKTFEEELQEKRDIELVHQLESEGGQPEEDVEEAAGPSLLVDEFDGKFFDKKKSKKRKHEEIERPPTPTEVIEQREIEWKERQKQRQDKQRKRHRGEDSGDENWSHDVMAEQASQECFESTIDEIVMDVDIDLLKQSMGNDEDEDGGEGDGQFLVDTYKMEMIRVEAQKLKEWRKLNKVNIDRLVKLITVLERNIRDVIPREGEAPLVTFLEEEIMDEDDPTTRELVDDRLLRAASAACTALLVMTGAKMPKQVFIEDAIDRSIQLCKQYLNHIVFPSSDIIYRSPNKQKKTEEKTRGRRKPGGNNRTPTAQRIYLRMNDLIGCFAELIRVQSLSDMAVHQLCTIAASTFFVNNIGEMQWQAMRLLSNIFNRYNDHMRHNILQDIVNSLHRLPSAKTSSNSLRISNETWLNNMTVLIMQLVQATVQMPKRKKKDSDENGTSEKEELEEADHLVKSSFESAFRIAFSFLQGFLQKCCSKGEEDNRPVFEAFLQDLLNALHKPEWPAAEFLLSILGNLLVKHYRATKGTEIALRTASLEYLGLITAKLKKDVRSAEEDADRRLEIVVKTLVYEELDDPPENIADVDIEDLKLTDKLKKLEQSLIDYLLLSRNDASTEYAVSFYACYWYKETAEDLDKLRLSYKAQKKKADESNEKELRKMEKKMEKLNEKGRAMKDYLIKIVDKRQMRKRIEHIKRNNQNVMMESDVAWAVKYLASRRELTQTGFENYLKQILYGVISEPTVSLRTKAMKCLTQIIEADHSVLGVPEVQNAVQARMVDPNAQVREATIELLGKYLVSRPDFIPKYYPILLERIKDSGTAVRKRVIRIMRELIEKNPSFDKTPEMLSRIVRRIGDEEGVKKLVIETFNTLWFQPLREHDQEALIKRVMIITEATEICVAEGTVEQLELLLTNVFKTSDKATIFACRQIVDCLVDNVLALETKMAADNSLSEINKMDGEDGTLANARRAKSNQDRMLACLTALSLFSKVRAELLVKHAETLQPYLSMTVNTAAETQVLKQVIDMLRRVIPLMSHPSDSFIDGLEDSFSQLLLAGKVTIIESAVECGGALHEKFPRRRPKMTDIFLKFLANLNNMKKMLERDLKSPVPEERVAFISRGIFCLGLLARYFDLDFVLEEEPDTIQKYAIKHELPPNPLMENHIAEDDEKPRVVRDNVFVLLCFFLGVPQATIQRNALISLGHLSAQYAEYLMRPEVRSMYNRFLGRPEPEFLAVKVLTLQNLERFLINEENRMQKHSEEWQKRKETEDLKEMDQAGSGLGSAVIQLYWNHVLNCYFNREKEVRNAAVQVTWRTLSQGLVTPGSSIPTLIAMMTDPLQTIRHKVENLLKEIDTKYQGMVQTKAVSGIRIAFQLHSKVNGGDRRLLRGIRLVEGSATANTAHKKTSTDEWGVPRYTNDGQALLSGLYQALRGNRQQRRSFLQSILRLFSEDSKEKLTLPELIFVGDNIAMFPYQVMDEPLYVIHEMDKIVPFSGESIIGHFKASLLPKSGPPGQPGKDDVEFEPEAIYRRLPNDKTHLFELMNNSQACFILLYLKTFLMKLYGFTEAKVQEYSPTDGAKLYEKAIGRKNVHMFCPQSAIAELDPSRVADRDTMKGHFNLSHQICNFHKMLLSLDRGEDDDDDVPQEEQQAEQDGDAGGRDDESDVDESDAPSETASHP